MRRMLSNKFAYLLTAFFFFTHHFLISQSQFKSLVDGYIEYNKNHTVEKVHVSTNREVFSLGDTVWLSSWTVLRHNQQPTDLSKILYVELIDPVDVVAERILLPIDELGRSAGHFVLSDSADGGQYHIRAYTRYQENFPTEFFFDKTIQVLPRLNTQVFVEQLPNPSAKLSVDLLPEGGHLVAGKLNYLAFKVTDESGFPLDVQGQIEVHDGKKIVDFRSMHDGMGLIQIQPERGTNYDFNFIVNDETYQFALPEVKDEGYLLHFWQDRQKVYFSADATGGLSPVNYALIHHHGKVLSLVQKKDGTNTIYQSIARELLPSGVMVITLFNEKNEAVAERIFFNHNKTDYTDVAVETTEKAYQKREKVSVSLSQTEAQLSSVSVSVVPSKLYKRPDESISSTLFLTSELRGKIHNPSYYTEGSFSDRMEHIDLLMLTHGWRKYNWDEIIDAQWNSLEIAPERGFTVEGRVSSFFNREKPLETDLYLSFFDDPLKQVETSTDSEGRFVFNDLEVRDTATVFIKTLSDKGRKREKDKSRSNSYLTIDKPSFPEVQLSPSRVVEEQKVDSATSQRGVKLFDIAAAFNDDVIILDEFVVEEEKDPFQDPIKREFKLYSQPDERVVMDSLPSIFQFGTVIDMLRAQMPGVIVTGTPPNQRISFQGRASGGSGESSGPSAGDTGGGDSGGGASAGGMDTELPPPTHSMGSGGPLILLNGIVTDVVVLNSILPFEVEFIDVIKGPRAVVYGSRASEGVIAVYTKKGSDRINPNSETPGFAKVKLPGYFPEKEFYSPDFANMSDDERVKPDFRNTIYWNPNLVLSERETNLSFYTSDEKGEFMITLEGLTLDGKIISESSTFIVE